MAESDKPSQLNEDGSRINFRPLAEGKKPDAAEWATDFALHYGLTDKERGGIEGMLRKCQRETLLWAAQHRGHSSMWDGVWKCRPDCGACELERLAEGRQP